ncbi:MAG: electron transport complex subunit RsxE [Eubacteriales bacterium]
MDKQQINLDSIKGHIGGFLKSGSKQLKEGIIDNNPILVQLLGTCPTLAVSTSVVNAVGMGIATTSVLVFSNLLISLLRRFIPKQVRIAAFIIVISGFVSAVELIIKAYFPALDRSLGVFIPLIVVNCIILARAEMFASKHGPLPSVMDGLSMGLGFMFGLILLASIRELIGAGTLVGYPVLGENYQPALLFIMPPGAFITLGFLIAFMQKMKNINSKNKEVLSDDIIVETDDNNADVNKQQKTEAKLKSETKAAEKAEAKAKTDAEKAESKAKADAGKAEAKAKADAGNTEEKAKSDAEKTDENIKEDTEKNNIKAVQAAGSNSKIEMIKDAILQAKNELDENTNKSENKSKVTDVKKEITKNNIDNEEKGTGGDNLQ